jgi:hypothetical protein
MARILEGVYMVAIHGHFDGRVIVPDEPLDLPRNQRLIVHVQTVGGPTAAGVDGKTLLRFAGSIDTNDLRIMGQAIEEDCEQVDRNGW